MITHKFISAKPDSSDATLINPSNWNAGHKDYNCSDTFDWSQELNSALSIGFNTIILTPVPPGINANNVEHFVWISGGTGTAEACEIVGGSAVSESTIGTII